MNIRKLAFFYSKSQQLISTEEEAKKFATLIAAGLQFLISNPELADNMGVDSLDEIVQYAVSHAIAESDTDMFGLVFTEHDQKLLDALKEIIEKHHGAMVNIEGDIEQAVLRILLQDSDYRAHDYNEHGQVNSELKALEHKIELINKSTNSDQLLDLWKSINSIPESSSKELLKTYFLNKTKQASNTNFKTFALENNYDLLAKIRKYRFKTPSRAEYNQMLNQINEIDDEKLRSLFKKKLEEAIEVGELASIRSQVKKAQQYKNSVSYEKFIDNVREIISFLEKNYSDYKWTPTVLPLGERYLGDNGGWIRDTYKVESQRANIWISYSFVGSKENGNYYTVLEINEPDNHDYHERFRVDENVIPEIQRELNRARENSSINMQLLDGIKERLNHLEKDSPADDKLKIFHLIKQLPEDLQPKMIDQLKMKAKVSRLIKKFN